MKIEEKINSVLERIRPFLISDGGNLEFVKYEDGLVYIRFLGACSHCPHIDLTISNGVEAMLIDEIPEVKGVVNVE